MNLLAAPYEEQKLRWPERGRHILAQYDAESLIVYQAYKPSIGRFAAQNGFFGGEFSFQRMSWCKPNFLWMMYRSGWGTKPDQETTLAIRLKRDLFESFLAEAVPSSYDAESYADRAAWSAAVAASDVRLQWDPDHSPSGEAVARRAIQIGLRGAALQKYGREAILNIEDITDFVAAQREVKNSPELLTPCEQVYQPSASALAVKLGLSQ